MLGGGNRYIAGGAAAVLSTFSVLMSLSPRGGVSQSPAVKRFKAEQTINQREQQAAIQVGGQGAANRSGSRKW